MKKINDNKFSNGTVTPISLITTLIAIAFMTIILLGIACVFSSDTSNDENKSKEIMKQIESGFYYNIYVDTETNVMYFIYESGGASVMVNSDGTPKLWKGEK